MVPDRARHADQGEYAPQGARVVLGVPRPVPLVQPPVDPVRIVGQPQLGDEPGEAYEEGRVEQALTPEQAMTTPAYPAEPKGHDEHGGVVGRRPVDHGLAVDPGRCPVAEAQPLPDMGTGQMNTPGRQQPGRRRDAAGD